MKRILFFIAWGAGLLIVFVFITTTIIYAVTKPYIHDISTDVPSAEVVLIPGAAISENGELSSIFIDRADMAIKLYEAEKVKKNSCFWG